MLIQLPGLRHRRSQRSIAWHFAALVASPPACVRMPMHSSLTRRAATRRFRISQHRFRERGLWYEDEAYVHAADRFLTYDASVPPELHGPVGAYRAFKRRLRRQKIRTKASERVHRRLRAAGTF